MVKIKYVLLANFSFFITVVSFAQQKLAPVKTPLIIFRNEIPMEVRDIWHHLDIEKDTLAGTSLNRAYAEIIKNKKGKPIIVSVIDTDIDIYHEDLRTQVWVNKKEISNNKIDDDKNGYIDDVNGWNFLGNLKGENMSFANTPSIRISRYLKKKYNNSSHKNNNNSDSLLYAKVETALKKDKEEIELLKKYSSENLTQYRQSLKILKKQFNKENFSFVELDSLYKKYKNDEELSGSIYVLKYYLKLGLNYDELKNDSLRVFYKTQMSYNEDYHDRAVIGDNEYDLSDNHYGNNNVSKYAKFLYHGTIVSGTIAANRANKKGANGFSDQIKIMPIVAAPYGGCEYEKDVVLAVRYAVDNGAKIINMSFGNPLYSNLEWIKEALLYAEKNDVLIVAGAGNDASDNDIIPFHPIDYDETTGVEFCNNFVKVGAINMDCNKSFLPSWTNYGKKTVDLFAPGYSIKTTDPNMGYSYRDGTSIASPVVAGVAALVRSQYPKLTAAQVKQILLDSSVQYDLQVQVPGQPEGTLKPFKELSKSGGVVNAYNALLMAAEMSKK
jgi:cell wall-associated protease